MKAVAINASPREKGNTGRLLSAVLAPLNQAGWETELVHIGGKDLHGCRACYKCFEKKNARCVFADDTCNDWLEKLYAADAVILGSPTYFSDVSAEMKGLIDRAGLVSIANGDLLAGKIGAAVVAVRRGGGTHAFDSMNHLFLMSGMVVPGSAYWNLGYGLNEGDVEKDAEAFNNMANLGRMIAWLGAAMADKRDTMPKLTRV
ncbi:flavodoxin family protein [Fundidesulfovibrio butyratiphilus]